MNNPPPTQPTAHAATQPPAHPQLEPDLLKSYTASDNRTLLQILNDAPTMIVFLRHFGCTFCMEAAHDIAEQQTDITNLGINIVFVHMSTPTNAKTFFDKYNLKDAIHIADPEQRLYKAFDLKRGSLAQLFGPKVIKRGFDAFVKGKHTVGKLQGDGFQMPGVFVMQGTQIIHEFRHTHAGDRPDYLKLASSTKL